MSDKKAFNRILIIDDDSASVFLTKLILEDLDVCEQILTATDGSEGLEKIKTYCLNQHAAKPECPDLILLDINMPVMDGHEVVEELHNIGQSNFIQARIVVLTTSSNPRDIDKMAGYGVKEYLVKPITEASILLLINKANSSS